MSCSCREGYFRFKIGQNAKSACTSLIGSMQKAAALGTRVAAYCERQSSKGDPMTPEELMAEAIAISREAVTNTAHRPFAAFIVKNGEIVGRGLNDTPSSHDPTAHGEVLAIRDATKRLRTQDLSG